VTGLKLVSYQVNPSLFSGFGRVILESCWPLESVSLTVQSPAFLVKPVFVVVGSFQSVEFFMSTSLVRAQRSFAKPGFFRRGGFLIVSGLLFGGVAGSAHHAFSWEFDAKKPVTVSGVVTRVDWINPHTYFYVDVKNGEGRAVNWIFETAGPNTLDRHGWHRDSVKKGDEITVVGFQARGAANIASARLIVLHDGRKVIVGSPGDGGPQF
jgi:hypothetical protein